MKCNHKDKKSLYYGQCLVCRKPITKEAKLILKSLSVEKKGADDD